MLSHPAFLHLNYCVSSVLVQYLCSSESILKLMLWRLDTLLKESDWKINTSIWCCCMKKKEKSLMEDKRNDKAQRPQTRRNPKRHISLVSLLLWCKMVAIRCFVWAIGLSGSEWVSEWVIERVSEWVSEWASETKFQGLVPATNKRFHVFNAVFYVRLTNIIASK